MYFNSRPSARGDQIAARASAFGTFQFTPLREGRRGSQARRRLPFGYFNSRPSARGDDARLRWTTLYKISIHAPPRGATMVFAIPRFAILFQFTPLREGRPHLDCREYRRLKHFNSRPSARGDGVLQIKNRHPSLFQFTPLREGRRRTAAQCRSPFYFNSRPSARGDMMPR